MQEKDKRKQNLKFNKNLTTKIEETWGKWSHDFRGFIGVHSGGHIGAQPPSGSVNSIVFKGVSGPNGCWAPPPENINKFKPLPLDKFHDNIWGFIVNSCINENKESFQRSVIYGKLGIFEQEFVEESKLNLNTLQLHTGCTTSYIRLFVVLNWN